MKRFLGWGRDEQYSPSVAYGASAPSLPFAGGLPPSSILLSELASSAPGGGAASTVSGASPIATQQHTAVTTTAAAAASAAVFSSLLSSLTSQSLQAVTSITDAAAQQQQQTIIQLAGSLNESNALNAALNCSPGSVGSVGTPQPQLITVGGQSAFSLVGGQTVIPGTTTTTSSIVSQSPLLQSPSTLTAALYPNLMCIPALLDRLTPRILRASPMPAPAPFKPIPNNDSNAHLDLVGYKLKEPREWTADDVVSWMLDTSRRRQIPFEDVNMTKFAFLPGSVLVNYSEAEFISNDPVHGSFFYKEFRDYIDGNSSPEERALEEFMKNFNKQQEEEQMAQAQRQAAQQAAAVQQMQREALAVPCLPSTSSCLQPGATGGLPSLPSVVQRMSTQSLASTLSAALSPSMGVLSSGLSPQSPLLQHHLHQPKLSPMTTSEMLMNKYQLTPQTIVGSSSVADYDSDESDLHGTSNKMIRKNKDGKPRKRSQHSKGNKLWEFIRDALKDPITCPSIVRWEDAREGVFRIVESERLARLWGERKNNQKMTYEKLSRAMRTYYEKQILVPVPKTGLYPKKLVYKFGPGANGWENCRALAGIPPIM